MANYITCKIIEVIKNSVVLLINASSFKSGVFKIVYWSQVAMRVGRDMVEIIAFDFQL